MIHGMVTLLKSTGEVHHIMREIILGGGLLTARSQTDKPMEKFTAFLESVEWPGSIGRVPSKVSARFDIALHRSTSNDPSFPVHITD